MPIVQVAAGLIRDDGCYLITRRKPGVHFAGFWEFPGGKRELGESLEECLRRELFEELSIRVGEPVLFRTVQHTYPEKTVELHFFYCTIEEGMPAPLDCAEIRWVRPSQLPQFTFPPADQVIIDALQLEEAAGQ